MLQRSPSKKPVSFPHSKRIDTSTQAYQDLLHIVYDKGTPLSETVILQLVRQGMRDKKNELKNWAEQVIANKDTKNPVVQSALVVIRNIIAESERRMAETKRREYREKLQRIRDRDRQRNILYDYQIRELDRKISSNDNLTDHQKRERSRYIRERGIPQYKIRIKQTQSLANAFDELPRPSPQVYMDDPNTQMLEKEALTEILKRVRL